MSVADLVLEGHTEQAEFALGVSSAEPLVASGGRDTNVSRCEKAGIARSVWRGDCTRMYGSPVHQHRGVSASLCTDISTAGPGLEHRRSRHDADGHGQDAQRGEGREAAEPHQARGAVVLVHDLLVHGADPS